MIESIRRIFRYVRRAGADKYFLLMLISFALSVTFTRAFLNLTGFPQIGTKELHFAHVLWGGLILFLASIIPLLFANRWVYPVGAILSGVGVGLFIDEVGKFITQSNNYFYPAAAPIIYGFFLVTVLLYTRISRKPEIDERTELYHVFDMMEEVLEHELDQIECAELVTSLERIRDNSTDEDYRHLSEELLHFLSSDRLKPGNKIIFWPDKIKHFISNYKYKWITNTALHNFSIISLIFLGVYTIIFPFRFIIKIGSQAEILTLVQPLVDAQLVISKTGVNWFSARLALEVSVGILLIISGTLLLFGKLKWGLSLAHMSLLLVFTTVDLLIFYYDQFSTIIFVTIQLIVFLAIAAYRRRLV